MSKVSINLLTWNAEKYIEGCLRSVFAQNFQDFSLIIIDNGSTDSTLEIINELYPHLSVIKHKDNVGFAKGHNQAIHWSDSEYVLCLNQDIVLEPDFLEKLITFMDIETMAGVVTGKILRLQDSQKTNYIDSLGLYAFKNFKVVDVGSGQVDEGQYDAAEEVFGVSGACPLFRRKALEELRFGNEFFDEDFFSYKEDVDLAFRLKYLGWQAWYQPRAVCYHDRTAYGGIEKKSFWQIIKNRKNKLNFVNYHSYKSHLMLVYKNLPDYKFKYLWPVFWYEFSKFLYILFFETKTLKAWSYFFKKKAIMKQKREQIFKTKRVEIEKITDWLK